MTKVTHTTVFRLRHQGLAGCLPSIDLRHSRGSFSFQMDWRSARTPQFHGSRGRTGAPQHSVPCRPAPVALSRTFATTAHGCGQRQHSRRVAISGMAWRFSAVAATVQGCGRVDTDAKHPAAALIPPLLSWPVGRPASSRRLAGLLCCRWVSPLLLRPAGSLTINVSRSIKGPGLVASDPEMSPARASRYHRFVLRPGRFYLPHGRAIEVKDAD